MYKKLFFIVASVLMVISLSACGEKKPESYGYYAIDSGKYVPLVESRIYSSINGKVIPHLSVKVHLSNPFKIVIYGNSAPELPMLKEVSSDSSSGKRHKPSKVLPVKVATGKLLEYTFDNLSQGEYVFYDKDWVSFGGRAIMIIAPSQK